MDQGLIIIYDGDGQNPSVEPPAWENVVLPHESLLDRSAGTPQVIESVETDIDREEVLRYVGYPVGMTPTAQMQRELDYWIDQARQFAVPQATYLLLPVERIERRELHLRTGEDVVRFHGAIGEFLGPSRWAAAFIATAGPGVEQLARELTHQGNELAALIVNAVGAERAEAAETAVIEQLRQLSAASGLAPTLPYSPGYCGMALTEQRALFALFRGQTVGVTLTEDCLMRPLKSVSGLIGLGPANEITIHGSPCDRCELYSCAMRR